MSPIVRNLIFARDKIRSGSHFRAQFYMGAEKVPPRKYCSFPEERANPTLVSPLKERTGDCFFPKQNFWREKKQQDAPGKRSQDQALWNAHIASNQV